MKNYQSDIDLIRRLHMLSTGIDVIEMVSKPALALAKLLGRKRLAKALSGVEVLDNWAVRVNRLAIAAWRLKYGTDSYHQSHAVRALTNAGDLIGTLQDYSDNVRYYDVMGIPVAPESGDHTAGFYSPASTAEILARVRDVGSRWLIDKDGGLHVDEDEVYPIRARQTDEIIERIRPHRKCRAWILWGPPRGGKSVAARQIADAIGGGWVRICGKAALSAQTWEAVFELAPAAIILDDLDTCANQESDLLGWLEQARKKTNVRVIISTMNILPGAGSSAVADAARSNDFDEAAPHDGGRPCPTTPGVKADAGERKRHELRGAILAPGRGGDETARHYARLDPEIRAALAPDVHEHLRPADLLAAYLVELQERFEAHGVVTQGDVDEMREIMAAVGDR